MSKQVESIEESTAIVALPLDARTIKSRFEGIQSFKESFIDKKTDVIEIQGRGFVKKSGWRKLAFAFNLSDEVVREEKEEKTDGNFVWRIWTKVTAPNGRTVVAVGAASSTEKRFSHLEHNAYALAATRSKNRAISDILGLGEVSAEEMDSEIPAETVKNVTPPKPQEVKSGDDIKNVISVFTWYTKDNGKGRAWKEGDSWGFANVTNLSSGKPTELAQEVISAINATPEKKLEISGESFVFDEVKGQLVRRIGGL